MHFIAPETAVTKQAAQNPESLICATAHQGIATTCEAYKPPFPPLELVTKPTLTTAEYAYYTNIAPQTARIYACKECGPIRATRINGRLHWSTPKTKALVGVPA